MLRGLLRIVYIILSISIIAFNHVVISQNNLSDVSTTEYSISEEDILNDQKTEEIEIESANNIEKEIAEDIKVEPETDKVESTILKESDKEKPKIENEKKSSTKKQKKSKQSKPYTDEELYILSHLINGEAGGHSKELQIGVGSVVLNRVKDERFPNTIKEVVFQKGQYACTWDGNYDKEPSQAVIDVAIDLLKNGSQLPNYIIFHANFRQANSTYKIVDGVYFCYYREDVK